ncbi:MAG: RagB/SusD family nutrient uptake outer membrane protein, partial [Daejeonella sp.]|uniref:RagB/SusD family nutrient uptake outer membrane protein n=1 Tax=Daejeonella sp. TaxID=2805397 RepID=UPI003C768122
MRTSILSLSLLVCLTLVTGCEESLDLYPPSAVSENVFWKQEKDALFAVNAVYRELDHQNMVVTLDGSTDIGYVRNSWVTWYKMGMGIQDALDPEVSEAWTRYYAGVRKANDVINNVDKISSGNPEVLKRVKAEARFLRAYFYTNLTSLFGDVPLPLEPLKITEQMSKKPKAEVVSFIISELDDIVKTNALPISYSGNDIGRATKGAALALKARLCIRNEKWAEAAAAAKAVMDLGVYGLFPNYGDLFTYAGENSKEVILSRQYAKGGLTHNALSWGPSSIGGSTDAEPVRKLFNKFEYKGQKDPANPYMNLDPRWGFSFYYPGSVVSTDGPQPVLYNSSPNASNTSIDKVNTQDNTSSHGWNIRKYIDYKNDKANPNQGAIDIILIRYADVLLMYAESKIELNELDASVYAALNQVRTRPSVEMPPFSPGKTQAELRAIVRNERCVELAFEGLRLFDMWRWNIGAEKAGLV